MDFTAQLNLEFNHNTHVVFVINMVCFMVGVNVYEQFFLLGT